MKFKNRFSALLLSIVFGFSSVNFVSRSSSNAEESQTVHNLVLFAQFEDLASYNFMDGRVDEIEQMCSDMTTVRSLAGYIDTISYGQMQIECHFPQLENGEIIPYQMSQSEDSYLNADLAAYEVVENVEVPEDIPLDGNNDGLVDNIILIVDASAENTDSLFWPCAFSLGGVAINDKSTGMINLHNSTSIFENYISGGAGVLCHEFLHSVGYPDLYRSDDRNGVPVGQWDIMASNSVFVQYPLAYMRYSVSGWLDAQTITQNGNYTLMPASSDNGNRLYLLKTPLSDTEFFAVEYRKQGAAYSEEMDVKIYGSGMVVYRVNTEVSGNHSSNMDQIYVFRPDETGLDAGEGDIFSSNYGGEGMLTEIGSLDFSDDITNGALVYSDGTNSGIKLSNITMSEDSLSFYAEFASTEGMDLWQTAAESSSLTGASMLDMTVSENGEIYVLCSENTGASLYTLQNGSLIKHSSISGAFYNGKIVTVDNVPYILYNDANFNYVLSKYNGSWENILQSDNLAQYIDIAINENKIYLAYTEGTYPYALSLLCYDTQSGNSQLIGDVIADNACSISLTVNENNIALGYRDLSNNSKPTLALFNGSSWDISVLSESSCDTIEIVSDGNKIHAALTGDCEGVYTISDDGTDILTYTEIPGSCFSALPVMCRQNIYVALNTQNEDDFSLYAIDESSLCKTGNSISAEIVNSPVVVGKDSMIYAAYISASGTVIIKSYTLSNNSSVRCDVNEDGNFSIADIVMLQQWLLCDGNLINASAADLDENLVIDAFDLCLMRRELINKF